MSFLYILADIAMVVAVISYSILWGWALYHAASTPKSGLWQRIFWAGSMIVNPSTIIWYWYIWKRWAFWLLFTPLFLGFASFPFVVRSVLSHAEATALTQILFALGSKGFLTAVTIFMIFPLLLRLRALLHLGKNSDLSAFDRNDWVVALALPVFGFGAGMAYCAKYQRPWAVASLLWWVAITASFRFMTKNISSSLMQYGELRREAYSSQGENRGR